MSLWEFAAIIDYRNKMNEGERMPEPPSSEDYWALREKYGR